MQHLKKLNTKLASLETQSLVAFMRLNPKTTFWAQGRNQPKDHLLGLGEDSTQRPNPGQKVGLKPKTTSWAEGGTQPKDHLLERRRDSNQRPPPGQKGGLRPKTKTTSWGLKANEGGNIFKTTPKAVSRSWLCNSANTKSVSGL
ncbi:unnamed protein product [Gadus morhua 'NCC']